MYMHIIVTVVLLTVDKLVAHPPCLINYNKNVPLLKPAHSGTHSFLRILIIPIHTRGTMVFIIYVLLDSRSSADRYRHSHPGCISRCMHVHGYLTDILHVMRD